MGDFEKSIEIKFAVLENELRYNTTALTQLAEQIKEIANEHRAEQRLLRAEVDALKKDIGDLKVQIEIGKAKVGFGGAILRWLGPSAVAGVIMYLSSTFNK